MPAGRDDAGIALAELIVAMVVSAILFGVVLTTMTASLRLIKAAPSDTNPHVFGALAAAAARLEARIAPNLECANPDAETNRPDCVDIVSHPATSRAHDGHAGCWVVTTETGRRLECWELLGQGDAVAHRYTPTAPNPDRLSPDDNGQRPDAWQDEPEASLPVAGGLAHLAYNPAERAWEPCAALRADQRQQLADTNVPFCDGTLGILDPDTGAVRTVDIAGTPTVCTDPAAVAQPGCVEGHPMPAVRIRP